jgi:hypothetical protein
MSSKEILIKALSKTISILDDLGCDVDSDICTCDDCIVAVCNNTFTDLIEITDKLILLDDTPKLTILKRFYNEQYLEVSKYLEPFMFQEYTDLEIVLNMYLMNCMVQSMHINIERDEVN